MLRLFSSLCFSVILGVTTMAYSKPGTQKTATDCSSTLNQGKFLQAAVCYEALVNNMPHGDKLSRLDKKRKALYLNKASYSLAQQARLTQDVAQQSYLYEQAQQRLQQILQEKLCLKELRCRLLRGQIAEFFGSIAYSRLVLVIQRKASVRVKVTGYQYSRQWVVAETTTLRLRPGTYTILHQEEGKPEKTSILQLEPRKSAALTLVAQIVIQKVVAPVSRVGPWTLLGIGIGMTVIAGVLVGVGYAFQTQADRLAAEQNAMRSDAGLLENWQRGTLQNLDETVKKWSSTSQTIDSRKSSGNIMVGAGWPAAGLGLGALIAGAVWLGSLPKASTPPPKQVDIQVPRPVGTAKASTQDFFFVVVTGGQ